MAIESAPRGRQGFYSSFVQIGVPLGVVLANLMFLLAGAVLSSAEFLQWGWRVAFLPSLALVGIGMFVQMYLEEPDEFERVVPAPSPILQVIQHHATDILLAGGAFVASNTCFYMAITYAVAFGAKTVGIPQQRMRAAVLIASAAMIPTVVASGTLSDRFGRRGIFTVGAALATLWAFAFFPLIETGSLTAVTTAITVELFALSLMYGPQAALFAELFPVELRYSGASLGYQVGAVFGGGFAPIIATALYERFHSSVFIGAYLFAICTLSLISIVALSHRAKRSVVISASGFLPGRV
jgi:MFS family permease